MPRGRGKAWGVESASLPGWGRGPSAVGWELALLMATGVSFLFAGLHRTRLLVSRAGFENLDLVEPVSAQVCQALLLPQVVLGARARQGQWLVQTQPGRLHVLRDVMWFQVVPAGEHGVGGRVEKGQEQILLELSHTEELGLSPPQAPR